MTFLDVLFIKLPRATCLDGLVVRISACNAIGCRFDSQLGINIFFFVILDLFLISFRYLREARMPISF